MEEKLVSFETAKLAKKKGFKEDCTHRFYYQEYHSGNGKWMHDVVGKFDWNCSDNISIPTQSLLQKWLREKHEIEIEVSFLLDDTYRCKVIPYAWSKVHKIKSKEGFTHYEDALETALKIGLNLVKNGKFKK